MSKLKGYQGVFFEKETMQKLVELQKNGLSNIVKDMHITFKYGELEKFPDELMEKSFKLKIIGYASDGKNSGFKVELPEELRKYYKNENPPHITVSLGEVNGVKGKAVDTGTMEFEELDEPVEITGKLGYFIYRKDRSLSGKVMNNSAFQDTRSKHSASEIVEGIKPTQTEVESAYREMTTDERTKETKQHNLDEQ